MIEEQERKWVGLGGFLFLFFVGGG